MNAAFMDYREVLVTGGTGFLGRQVARALIARGFLPRLLVRDGSESRIPEDVRRSCRVTPGDVTDYDSVENAAQGTGAVVHLAGIVREFPARGITFDRLHVRATRNAVKAARRWGISRFVHVSALGAWPGDPGAFFDSKGRGEAIVANSGLRWTIYRPSVIFGPGDRFVDTLLAVLRRSPVAAVPGSGRVRFQPVFVGDVAHAVADAVTRPQTEERSIDVGGPERLSLDEIVDAVSRALGRRIPKVHVPLALLRPLVRSLSRFERFPFSPQEIEFLAADNICESGPYWSAIGRAPLSLDDYLESVTGRRKRTPATAPRTHVEPRKADRGPASTERIEPPPRKVA